MQNTSETTHAPLFISALVCAVSHGRETEKERKSFGVERDGPLNHATKEGTMTKESAGMSRPFLATVAEEVRFFASRNRVGRQRRVLAAKSV